MLLLDFTRLKLSYCVKLPVAALSYAKDIGIVKRLKKSLLSLFQTCYVCGCKNFSIPSKIIFFFF